MIIKLIKNINIPIFISMTSFKSSPNHNSCTFNQYALVAIVQIALINFEIKNRILKVHRVIKPRSIVISFGNLFCAKMSFILCNEVRSAISKTNSSVK